MRKEGKEQASRNRETFPRTPTHLARALGHHHTAEFQPRYLANGEPACSIVPFTTTVTAATPGETTVLSRPMATAGTPSGRLEGLPAEPTAQIFGYLQTRGRLMAPKQLWESEVGQPNHARSNHAKSRTTFAKLCLVSKPFHSVAVLALMPNIQSPFILYGASPQTDEL